jgi:hypothetical protein
MLLLCVPLNSFVHSMKIMACCSPLSEGTAANVAKKVDLGRVEGIAEVA